LCGAGWRHGGASPSPPAPSACRGVTPSGWQLVQGNPSRGIPRSPYSSMPLPHALDSAHFEEELSRASWQQERGGGSRGGGGARVMAIRLRRRRMEGRDPRRGLGQRDANG
jgi:hypothetical protein